VKLFLKEEFRRLSDERYIDEWISSHLEYYEQRGANFIAESIIDFVNR